MQILTSAPGMVQVIHRKESATPSKIQISVGSDRFEPMSAIITEFAFQYGTRHQFLPSLNDVIYVYVFGDRMGALVLNGIAFAQRCGTSEYGPDKVFEYYAKNKLSNQSKLMQVAVGNTIFRGFLIEMSLNLLSGDSPLQLTRFKYVMSVLPVQNKLDLSQTARISLRPAVIPSTNGEDSLENADKSVPRNSSPDGGLLLVNPDNPWSK